MKKLIILSDIFGKNSDDWIQHYILPLSQNFEVIYLDSRVLADIPLSISDEKTLHHLFVHGGIELAQKKLLSTEYEVDTIVGFSVGGAIAWKACLSGLKVRQFFAISSTRLRLETEKPDTKIALFYAENDNYKPDIQWFNSIHIFCKIFPNEIHTMYKKAEIADEICQTINLRLKLS